MPQAIRNLSQDQRWAAIAQAKNEYKSTRRIAKELHCDEANDSV